MRRLTALLALTIAALGCDRSKAPEGSTVSQATKPDAPKPKETRLATFGGGCFWCVDAIFTRLEGVLSVESGYSGGGIERPSYEDVCSGRTGHAEVVQVAYDPAKVSYDALLEVFFKTHDPTTLNRQGADRGTQYRSIVLFHDDEQRRIAHEVKKKIEDEKVYDDPLVTEIVPFQKFWKAEDYHQGYYDLNPGAGYCRVVISPKVEKLEKLFRERLKKR